jgi:hypothetical protein
MAPKKRAGQGWGRKLGCPVVVGSFKMAGVPNLIIKAVSSQEKSRIPSLAGLIKD